MKKCGGDSKNVKYCFVSGIMIAFGASLVLASVIQVLVLESTSLLLLGIPFGGCVIGVGLLPFCGGFYGVGGE